MQIDNWIITYFPKARSTSLCYCVWLQIPGWEYQIRNWVERCQLSPQLSQGYPTTHPLLSSSLSLFSFFKHYGVCTGRPFVPKQSCFSLKKDSPTNERQKRHLWVVGLESHSRALVKGSPINVAAGTYINTVQHHNHSSSLLRTNINTKPKTHISDSVQIPLYLHIITY